jgi:hypothetical protein
VWIVLRETLQLYAFRRGAPIPLLFQKKVIEGAEILRRSGLLAHRGVTASTKSNLAECSFSAS